VIGIAVAPAHVGGRPRPLEVAEPGAWLGAAVDVDFRQRVLPPAIAIAEDVGTVTLGGRATAMKMLMDWKMDLNKAFSVL
jgi:hypothetical protein